MAAVITNGHLRELCTWEELPSDEVRAAFDYARESSSERFVQYRGSWYDVNDTQRLVVGDTYIFGEINLHPSSPLVGWEAMAFDSMWSGIAFRWPTDAEVFKHDLYSDRYGYVIVGRYVA